MELNVARKKPTTVDSSSQTPPKDPSMVIMSIVFLLCTFYTSLMFICRPKNLYFSGYEVQELEN